MFQTSAGSSARLSTDSILELPWLADIWDCTIAQIAYYENAEGYQTVYHVLRRAEEKTSLCLLQTDPDGMLKAKALDIITPVSLFEADNTLSASSRSGVILTVEDPVTRRFKTKSIGYIEGKSGIVGEFEQPLFNTFRGSDACYYVEKVDTEPNAITKISPVSSNNFLRVQFGSDLEVTDKVLIICFAKKIFSTYFQIPFRNLARCDGRIISILRAIAHANQDSNVNLHDGRNQYELNVPKSEFDTQNAVSRPSASPLDKVTFRKSANIPALNKQIFTADSAESGEPLLYITGVTAQLKRADISSAQSGEQLFIMTSFSRTDEKTEVICLPYSIGHIVNNQIFDKKGAFSMFGENKRVPVDKHYNKTFTVFDAAGGKQDCARAFISYSQVSNELSLSMRPCEVHERYLILAFAIKLMFCVCKFPLEGKNPCASTVNMRM